MAIALKTQAAKGTMGRWLRSRGANWQAQRRPIDEVVASGKYATHYSCVEAMLAQTCFTNRASWLMKSWFLDHFPLSGKLVLPVILAVALEACCFRRHWW